MLPTSMSVTKLKQGGIKNGYFKNYTGTLGELESEKVVLQNKVNRYDNELAEFKVHPHYEDIQQEANQLTKQIHKLSETVTVQKSLLEKYEKDIEAKEEKKAEVEAEYQKAGLKNDVGLLMELQEKIDSIDMEILELMSAWEDSEKELSALEN